MKSNFRFFSTLLHFSPKHSLGKIKLQTRDGVGVLQIVKYPYQYDILDKLHNQYHLLAPTINYYISIESKESSDCVNNYARQVIEMGLMLMNLNDT